MTLAHPQVYDAPCYTYAATRKEKVYRIVRSVVNRRVALNRGYNLLRGERRERARVERLAEAPTQADPHAELVRAEERALVRAALARLPERQGKLLLLRYAGLSYAEIAAIVEVAPGSVGTLLSRAERAFLTEYKQMEPDHAML